MAESSAVRRTPGRGLLAALFGALAGAFPAAGLVLGMSPTRALIYVGALGGGVLTFLVPHAGLYLLTAASIAQWPGNMIRYVGLAVTGSTFLWALAERRLLVPWDSIFVVIAAYAGLVGISALRVGDSAARSYALSYAAFLLLYWATSTLATKPAVVRRIVGVMVVSGVVIALIAVVQFKYPFLWITSQTRDAAQSRLVVGAAEVLSDLDLQVVEGVFRADSLTGTPNYLGLTMQILMPFAFFWGIRQPTRGRLIVGMVTVGILGVGFLLSFTRGVMVTTALIVVPLVMVRFDWRRAVPILLAFVLLGGIAVVAYEPLRARVLSIVPEALGQSETTAAGWRRTALGIAWRMFRDYFWTGVGIGRHKELWSKYSPWEIQILQIGYPMPIHNGYLLIAVELGVWGLLAVITLMLLTWWRVRRLQHYFRSSGQRSLLDMTYALEAVWVAMIVDLMLYSILDTSFRYFWVLLALVGALSRVAADQQGKPWRA